MRVAAAGLALTGGLATSVYALPQTRTTAVRPSAAEAPSVALQAANTNGATSVYSEQPDQWIYTPPPSGQQLAQSPGNG